MYNYRGDLQQLGFEGGWAPPIAAVVVIALVIAVYVVFRVWDSRAPK